MACRALDITAAVLALIVLAVPMVVIGLMIRWSSIGPALFRQQRVGHEGYAIRVWSADPPVPRYPP